MAQSGHGDRAQLRRMAIRRYTDPYPGSEVMTKNRLDGRFLLTPGQKAEAAKLRTMGFTRSQAWRRVLTPEQRQVSYDQIRTAERLRYIKNPQHEESERAPANAVPNTMLGSLRLPRMIWTGRRIALSYRGSNSMIRAVTETIQRAHPRSHRSSKRLRAGQCARD